MNSLLFDDFGSLIEPSLHDALIYRIDFKGNQVDLYCHTPEAMLVRLELRGVLHMYSTGLAEQNVILDVSLEEEREVCARLIERWLPGSGASQLLYRNRILERIQAKELMLLRFLPSYGGEVLVLCTEANFDNE